MRTIKSSDLRTMKDSEGLILQGCGGDLQEWVDGINGILIDEGILLDGTKFDSEKAYSFENEGVTNLLLPFTEDVNLNMGKLAMWRLQTHSQFGGTWLTDYVDNRLGGFVEKKPEQTPLQKEKPDCALIGQDGNIFNLMGLAARTLRRSGMTDEAKEMCEKITASASYGEALCIIGDYVNITSIDDEEDDSEDEDEDCDYDEDEGIRLEDLRYALEVRGYHYVRDDGYEHATVIADGWKRPVRIDSLGSRYTETALRGRVMDNLPKLGYYHEMYVPERARFYELVQERYTRYSKMSVIELIFATILELFEIHVIPEPKDYVYYEPLSPVVRAEEIASERYMDCFNLITRNSLHDETDIDAFIASKEAELSGLEAERRQVDNYRRRHKDEPGVAERCKAARRELTEKIIPVRHTLGLAREIMPRFNRAVELLQTEKQTEERLVPDVIERQRNKPKQNTKEKELCRCWRNRRNSKRCRKGGRDKW